MCFPRVAADPPTERSPQFHQRKREHQDGQARQHELCRWLRPETGLHCFLSQVQESLDQIVEFASALPKRPESDRILIADPENLGANEPVFLVEDGEAPSDLLEGMGCSFRELFEGLLAAHQDLSVFFLEVEQDVLSRSPSLGRDASFKSSRSRRSWRES